MTASRTPASPIPTRTASGTTRRPWRPSWLDINGAWTILLLLGSCYVLLAYAELADDNLLDCGP